MQGGETRSSRYRYATSSCYVGSQMATGSHRPGFTSSPMWQLSKLMFKALLRSGQIPTWVCVRLPCTSVPPVSAGANLQFLSLCFRPGRHGSRQPSTREVETSLEQQVPGCLIVSRQALCQSLANSRNWQPARPFPADINQIMACTRTPPCRVLHRTTAQ